ncbi:MAG: CopD family protein [Gammaproteobacteria bacterium]|nr:CopD family protein [Gammaproteobacteria bacterium]
MLWVKAIHVFFVVSWFAAIFYLPRLFVYHAETHDEAGKERFKIMERKLFAMMKFTSIGAIGLGLWMAFDYAWAAYSSSGWFHAKMLLVVILLGYQYLCSRIVRDFREDRNTRSHVYYRWFNEFPVFILLGISILVVVRPF